MAKKKVIGILYSEKLNTGITIENVEHAVENGGIAALKEAEIKPICADVTETMDFENVDILVNTLGAYYPESGWGKILNYYRNGGVFLNIGSKPFSVPYCVAGEEAQILPETAEAYHSLGIIDEYVEIPQEGRELSLKVFTPRYRFIEEMNENGQFPVMKMVCSPQYTLTETCIPSEETWLDNEAEVDSDLETACGWYDADGRLLSVPIAKVEHRHHGTMVFMNFTPEDSEYYSTEAGEKLLANMLYTCFAEKIHMEFWTDYPRYHENETPELRILLNNQSKVPAEDSVKTLKYVIADRKSGEVLQEITNSNLEFAEGFYEDRFNVKNAGEGFYSVKVSFYVDGEIQQEKTIGFYIISDASIQKELEAVKPIYVNTEKSADFCLRDDKVFAMHGTTYFVTDNYRWCYDKFNLYQCDEDLKNLKEMGFNILRSGFWQSHKYVFDNEGNIFEKTLRNLEAFFLTAARYGFAVQFVPGVFVFNPWDRKKCAIHNPEMKEKVLRVYASFAERFHNWTNVQMDAINEPSYSVAGLWNIGKPSGDPYELAHWREWLREKYQNDIALLRQAWGIGSHKVTSFEELEMPKPEVFSRNYYGKPGTAYIDYGAVSDFYEFARASYSAWLSDIRNEIKSRNKDTMFMFGRDESLRIPCQQYEAYKGNIDMINWHQWNGDAYVFMEYALNKVRGLPCCGQELGVYHYSDMRGATRMTEEENKNVLERKLLYTFGNWLQWQSYSDPTMLGFNEVTLGIFRADRSETPYAGMTRRLAWFEEQISQYLLGREEDATEVLTVHPSTAYYSANQSFALQGIRTSVLCTNYYLKKQSDMVLEHLFKEDNQSQIGNPKLIIFPATMLVAETAWQQAVKCMNEGATVLVSGTPDVDEYWRTQNRLKELGIETELKNICGHEKLTIGDEEFVVSFRGSTGNSTAGKLLSKNVYPDGENKVRVFPVGKGQLIHCSVPVEIGDSYEPVVALYRFAMEQAGVTDRICRINETETKQNLLLYPMSYKDCTVYTLVNEGNDDSIRFTDLASGVEVEMHAKAMRGCKICLSKSGELLGGYIHDRLKAGERELIPEGDVSFAAEDGKLKTFAGVISERECFTC